ncbi:DNA-binding response regulator [Geomonas sp.]|uniref:helix-turn-helix transcriptional regulator n=1 Tax=Geomonas sp. TaxID=2651584 RepID=UPI002B486267|nr:DNA-binding response regulator [Geomonas sp.]HJV33781.1 DNA-binding response regulator [Geomonas sp.]
MAVVTIFHEHGCDCLNPWGVDADRREIVFGEAPAALQKLEVEVAVVLCDRDVEQGLWLLGAIKARFPATPVVFITARSSEEVVTRAFKGGARDYFRIPFDPRLVAGSLERILSFKRGARPASPPVPPGNGSAEPSANRSLPDGIVRAISLMERNLIDTLCLDDLAKAGYMSKYHFCRTFKRHLGISPLQFYSSRRIERAKEFLQEPECTISRAAFKSGFNDLSDFCRQFKKITGITPKAYRRTLQTEFF